MAAGSPIAALEPARPASPLKALSFWGAGLVQRQPPAFPAKMSKLWARPRGSDFGLWAPLSAITRARRWLMLSYRRRIWLRESEVPQGDGRRGGRVRVPPRAATPAQSLGSASRPRRAAALRPRYQSSAAPGRMKSGARYPSEEPALARKIVQKIT